MQSHGSLDFSDHRSPLQHKDRVVFPAHLPELQASMSYYLEMDGCYAVGSCCVSLFKHFLSSPVSGLLPRMPLNKSVVDKVAQKLHPAHSLSQSSQWLRVHLKLFFIFTTVRRSLSIIHVALSSFSLFP